MENKSNLHHDKSQHSQQLEVVVVNQDQQWGKCDIYIRTFEGYSLLKRGENEQCSSEALNKCDPPLRRPVLHIMKCQESQTWWINLSSFNHGIISSTARFNWEMFWVCQSPLEFSVSLWFLFCCIASQQQQTYTHFLLFHDCMNTVPSSHYNSENCCCPEVHQLTIS